MTVNLIGSSVGKIPEALRTLSSGGAAAPAELGALPPWAKTLGTIAGIAAVIGGVWWLSQGADTTYSVELSSKPDLSNAHTPSEVYAAITKHFDAHDDAIRGALDALTSSGAVKSYSEHPIENNFIVTVSGRHKREFFDQLQSLPDVGGITADDLS
jgi:hypothetical protein